MRDFLVSTAVLPMCVGRMFYEWEGIFEAYELLGLNGIELVFLPEWDSSHPPLTPTSANWIKVPKITIENLVDLCHKNGVRVPSVHINRDVGNMLCSSEPSVILEGQAILYNNLMGASKLRSEISVLHLWDTRLDSLDLKKVFNKAYEVAKDFAIKIAIENVPVSDKLLSPAKAWAELVELMPEDYGFTLDLSWCSLYNDFSDLSQFRERILNIHVQGYTLRVSENCYTLVPRAGSLNILECLSTLCLEGYKRFVTLEMNKPSSQDDFKRALELIQRSCEEH